MPRRCGQSAPPTNVMRRSLRACFRFGCGCGRVARRRHPVRPRQVVQSPPWLVATQQAEPAPLPPLSGEFAPAHQSSGAGGCVVGGTRGGNAVDELQRCEVQLICLGTTLVTGGLAALFGQRYQLLPLCVSHLGDLGVDSGAPVVNIDKAARPQRKRSSANSPGGLAAMAKMRKVTTVRGYGAFVSTNHVEVEETTGTGQEDRCQRRWWPSSAIIAAGSQAVRLPFMPEDPRVVDSTGALVGKCPSAC